MAGCWFRFDYTFRELRLVPSNTVLGLLRLTHVKVSLFKEFLIQCNLTFKDRIFRGHWLLDHWSRLHCFCRSICSSRLINHRLPVRAEGLDLLVEADQKVLKCFLDIGVSLGHPCKLLGAELLTAAFHDHIHGFHYLGLMLGLHLLGSET